MPQPRKLNEGTLATWDAQGLTAAEMHRHLAAQGIAVSIDLVRKRLQEVRRASRGEPPTPKPTRKSSATVRRQGQVADALALVEALKEDLQGTLDGWATASPAASGTGGSRWRSGSWNRQPRPWNR